MLFLIWGSGWGTGRETFSLTPGKVWLNEILMPYLGGGGGVLEGELLVENWVGDLMTFFMPDWERVLEVACSRLSFGGSERKQRRVKKASASSLARPAHFLLACPYFSLYGPTN